MVKKFSKGYALPIIFIFLVILLSISYVAYNLSIFDIRQTDKTLKQEDALYYAEAGFNRYLYFLNEDSKFYKTTRSGNLESQASIAFKDGFYSLSITAPSASDPYLTIESTGWVSGHQNDSRTIAVKVRRRQFTNYVYGTGQETLPNGTKVWWTNDDVVDGPLHTNGTLNIDGDPVFNGEVSYSNSLNVRSGSDPEYNDGDPYQRDPLIFPENNDELITWAQSPDGLYFQGRTCILLDGDELQIRNQNGSTQTYDIPANGVIYVDNLNNEMDKFDIESGNVFISGELDGQLTIASQNSIYITGHDPTNWNSLDYTGGITYSNQTFDEDNNDMLGLTAQRNIEILHHGWPRYEWINTWWGGYWSDHYSESNDVSINDITINGALFALDGSFAFEDHNDGWPKGTITMKGSMVQSYRGAVGTFSTWSGDKLSGYDKNYSHDIRMRYDTPPHFLEPENAGWEIIGWSEIY